ncbi:putative aldehyde dehydrogenase family [Trypanosoma theileri]|uniref:Aldehyde dehydrogenase n=1 Tax=Trypanosoma theileri TaxID=67003 RepID=A0A1X0P1T0_9TRYP|nr:putative aldehyde dehydrogenase family [Trypanosoma theileri]ORC90906.1 putative aldehyde dehydrogenase family [Trypanosoma theileri]
MTTTLDTTPLTEIPTVVNKCRQGFQTGAIRSIKDRKSLLRSLLRMLDENESALCTAVHTDLRKHVNETTLMELSVLRAELYHMLENLNEYTAVEKLQLGGAFVFEDCEVRSEPLGVVLVIGAWNYPVQLTLLPLLGAIAAGNTVVLKPSELAPATAYILEKLLSDYLPENVVGVVNGGVVETTRLLEERFDHIFYTGGSRVATIVMAAAAKHLTPVTLELGGKSPVVVDKTCEKDMKTVARRIMWGKVVNAGQTCVAPDYILVQNEIKDKLIEALKNAREEMMGVNPLNALEKSNYPSIVNINHFQRLVNLLNGGTVVFGGEMDESSLTIAPAVLTDISLDHPLMTDEIFGPLLPIIPFKDIHEVLNFLSTKEKPLALYIFSNDKHFIKEVEQNTSSGAVTVNDVLIHAGMCGLPFGGVGQSGMGAYHGKYSFDTFSHKKPILRRKMGMETMNIPRYPPYTKEKLRILRKALEPQGERTALGRRLWFFSGIPQVCAVTCQFLKWYFTRSNEGGKREKEEK